VSTEVWTPPSEPPTWVRRAHELLPERPKDEGRTRGCAFTTDGQPLLGGVQICSGTRRGLVSDLDLDRQARLSQTLHSHVEAQVAAKMRRPGRLPDEVVLVINNRVCRGQLGCRTVIGDVLRAGQRLYVYERDRNGRLLPKPVVLVGTGEGIRR
jgi:hypothetical protein